MNKYTKDALVQYLIGLVIAVSTGVFLSLLATTIGIANTVTVLAVAVFLFCSYKYIKIQAEINERLDKLNNK
jgi:hypothetical protein